MIRHALSYPILSFSALLALVIPVSCDRAVVVAVIGNVSGAQGVTSADSRDGALLAAGRINESGGVSGRMLEIEIYDDLDSPDEARRIDSGLIERGVPAVIGHVSSSLTAAVLPLFNGTQTVLFSSASSSDQFSGIDDNFFRIIADTRLLASALARHIALEREILSVTAIADTTNAAFSGSFVARFREAFGAVGGECLEVVDFDSRHDSIRDIVRSMASDESEAFLLVLNPENAAEFAQYAWLEGIDRPVFASSWSVNPFFAQMGGIRTEGIEMVSHQRPDNTSEVYLAFIAAFRTAYGREPSQLAANGYLAMMYLAKALELSLDTGVELRRAMIGVVGFSDFQGSVRMDPFGDAIRDCFIVSVREGRFVTIARFPATGDE